MDSLTCDPSVMRTRGQYPATALLVAAAVDDTGSMDTGVEVAADTLLSKALGAPVRARVEPGTPLVIPGICVLPGSPETTRLTCKHSTLNTLTRC